jgi:hypothetical protein
MIGGFLFYVYEYLIDGEKMSSKQDNQLIAAYKGVLPIGDLLIDCAVLSDGTRVLTATSIFNAFDRARKGVNDRAILDDGTKLPPFIAAKSLLPYVTDNIKKWSAGIVYLDGEKTFEGYPAEMLPEICGMYLKARRDNSLHETQIKSAIQAEIILEAFAKVGIIALIDEATGFQVDRKKDALRFLLQQYVEDGMRAWLKTFPDSFFDQLDKLYGNPRTTSRSRPQYYGKFINKHIYNPIEFGYVKQELDKLNITDNGTRKARFHQWLTNHGRTTLIHQIGRVQALMEINSDIETFESMISRQKSLSIAPELFENLN